MLTLEKVLFASREKVNIPKSTCKFNQIGDLSETKNPIIYVQI